jgi:Protein of unknown function, DUF624
MQWLEAMWTREGKGIDKDAPKRTGLALFGQIIAREWWELVKLNLLFILASLPLVTLPAATFATASICRAMVEDRNVYLLRDFLEAFRRHALRAAIWSIATGVVLALGIYAIATYGAAARDNLLYAAPLTVSLMATVFAGLWATHFMVLSVTEERPLRDLLRLSALASLWRPLPLLGALGFVASLWLAHILFYPVSVFMPATLNFSVGLFAVMFGAQRAATLVLSWPVHRSGRKEPI